MRRRRYFHPHGTWHEGSADTRGIRVAPSAKRRRQFTKRLRDTCMERGAVPNGQKTALPGGAKGTRTPDPHTASVVRYQLRHSP